MVSAETLLSYPDWKITFTVHTNDSNKHLVAVILQNNKPIVLLSRKLNNIHYNYAMTKKELLEVVECIKKFHGITFGYAINVFCDHKNLVYVVTLSKFQRVIHCWLIIEEFGPNTQHIPAVDNIVADMLSMLPYKPVNKYEPRTSKAHFPVNKLVTIGRVENNKDCFLINILNEQKEKKSRWEE